MVKMIKDGVDFSKLIVWHLMFKIRLLEISINF